MKKWLYIISNRSQPGMVQIGLNEDHPASLARALNMTGSSPFPYTVDFKLLLKDDCYHIVQNIRKALWIDYKNIALGWYSISLQEALILIRSEVAAYILGKYILEIQRGHNCHDLATLMKVFDAVIVIKEDSSPDSTVVTYEAREIAKIIADIIKNENWRQNGLWLNRITGNNSRYSLNQHCLTS